MHSNICWKSQKNNLVLLASERKRILVKSLVMFLGSFTLSLDFSRIAHSILFLIFTSFLMAIRSQYLSTFSLLLLHLILNYWWQYREFRFQQVELEKKGIKPLYYGVSFCGKTQYRVNPRVKFPL